MLIETIAYDQLSKMDVIQVSYGAQLEKAGISTYFDGENEIRSIVSLNLHA